MNKAKEEQLKRFANNTEMNEAVKEVLLGAFLRKVKDDVNILASQTLAYNLLLEGWREIMEYQVKEQEKRPEKQQVGI